jgi:hypothetical protein
VESIGAARRAPGVPPKAEPGADAGPGAAQRRRLLAAGVPARAIMEVLGHSEIGVTMNTCAHVLPKLREEAADAIDELFGA